MDVLDGIVLPIKESRALVDHGVVLHTALSYYPVEPSEEVIDDEGNATGREPREGDKTEFVFVSGECDNPICPAPVLSELLDAIRKMLGQEKGEMIITLNRDGSEMGATCLAINKYVALGITDLQAAAEFLMGASA